MKPAMIVIDMQDKKIIKTYGNAFNKTDLGKILNEEDVDSVMLAGFCAEYCVLSTYHGAKDLDLNPFLLKNAVAGGVKEHIDFVEKICETMSLGPLSQILG
jgi:nicotinamidase-related amidase